MTGNLITLFIVMMVAGILGGMVNYLIGAPGAAAAEATGDGATVEKRRTKWRYDPLFRQSIVMGIAASFVVPVFLQIAAIGVDANVLTNFLIKADSNIAKDQASGYGSLAIIFGFCILAAVSSRSFLQNLSNKMLQQTKAEAQQARDLAKEAAQDVEGVRRMTTALDTRMDNRILESDPGAELEEATDTSDEEAEKEAEEKAESQPALQTTGTGDGGELNDIDRQILKALAAKPDTRRSIKGIRTDPVGPRGQSYQTCRSRLHRMHTMGYVRKLEPIKGGNLPRWKLDAKGWASLD